MPIRKRTRKDGKTVFDVRVEYNGLRMQKTVPTTSTEARRVESRLLHDLINGRFEILKSKENPRFREYAEAYKKLVTWQKSYERTCFSLKPLVAFFGARRLTEITVADFIKYRAARLAEVSRATINREHACLKRMLNIAVKSDEYVISKNSVSEVKLFKEHQAEDRTLSVAEYHKLLAVAPQYFKRIIVFACNTAMRKSEILNLKFSQIKLWPGGTEVELTDTKSGDTETVPLNEQAKELVFEIAAERGIDLRDSARSSGHVFLGKYGRPIKDLRGQMQVTFANADIGYRPFHTFRHFWTSEMFNAGVDVAKIKKIGRWKDLGTMLRYCHSSKSEEHSAVNALSSHLNQPEARVLAIKAR